MTEVFPFFPQPVRFRAGKSLKKRENKPSRPHQSSRGPGISGLRFPVETAPETETAGSFPKTRERI